MYDRTGFHTPQRAIQLQRPSLTNDPVGIHERLGPIHPGSCVVKNDNMSVLFEEDGGGFVESRTGYTQASR